MRRFDLRWLPLDGGLSHAELIAAAERELRRRQNDYPKRIATGRLSLRRARHEIEAQRRIVELLKGRPG